jgi:hypothetical protein
MRLKIWMHTCPFRGFCIGAPGPNSLERFIAFVQNELAPRQVNTLILRVDYRYQYESYPKMRANEALTKDDVKKTGERLPNQPDSSHSTDQSSRASILGFQSGKSIAGISRI